MPAQNPSPNIEDFSEKQLKFAVWYVSHKLLLKKILIGFLIAIGAIFWIYGLYGIVNYYFIEGPKFSRALKELSQPINYSSVQEILKPKVLEMGTVSIISAGKEKYDLLVPIFNSNPNWRAEFNYDFIVDGNKLAEKRGFILPNEEKFLLNLGLESKTKPRRAEVEIYGLNWKRIDAHEIPDYTVWSEKRLDFSLADVKFSPAVIRDTTTTSRASFNVKNSTAYSFWDVGFFVLLYRGSSLAGVNYVTLEEFLSGQVRSVEVSWFDPLPSITQVKVVPEVNIFDAKMYMPVE